jgi:hypothetical protein
MGLVAKDGGSGMDFPKAPEGTHLARCCKVIDLGTQYNKTWDSHNHKIMLVWELPTELIPEGELAGEPFGVAQVYTLSLGEKANLRKDLEAWRGKAFSEEELSGFSIDKLLGQPCYLGVTHNKTPDKVYVNVSSIMKLPKGIECPQAINEPVSFDLDRFDPEVFGSFSEGLKKWIAESPEYQNMQINQAGGPGQRNCQPHEGGGGFEDDDIPF